MLHSLEAEVCSMEVELAQVAIDRGRGTELHVLTQVVPALLAQWAHPARGTWLYGNTVTCMIKESLQ